MATPPEHDTKSLRVLHYIAAFSSPSQTFIYDLICGLNQLGVDNAVATRAAP